MNKLRSITAPFSIPLFLLILWEASSRLALASPQVLPAPTKRCKRLV